MLRAGNACRWTPRFTAVVKYVDASQVCDVVLLATCCDGAEDQHAAFCKMTNATNSTWEACLLLNSVRMGSFLLHTMAGLQWYQSMAVKCLSVLNWQM